MHLQSIEQFQHRHHFLGEAHGRNEQKTWAVIVVCALMMLAEIVGGLWFGSVALIADGLHMSTHAGALLIAALAYTFARKFDDSERLSFGTGKLGDLAAFSSAIILAMIALLIGFESVERWFNPVPIAFAQAIPIAVLGLCVNLLSVLLLKDEHHHDTHGRSHQHGEDEHDHTHLDQAHGNLQAHAVHVDHNLRAAFVHVVADAAVSVLVIVGLLSARQFNWMWMDPLMGLIATGVILSWSWTLIRSAGAVLLDANPDAALSHDIVQRLETNGDRVADLHLWRLGPGHLAAVVSVISDSPQEPGFYKRQLATIPTLSHLTIEVLQCPGPH